MKMKITLFIIIIFALRVHAQEDTLQTNNLLDDLSSIDTESTLLLPKKILITQRMFWGNKGLMRNSAYFKLTPEKRQRELKVRRIMLSTHQALGFATLAGMVAQGIIGTQLYNGNTNLKDTHELVAVGINISYFTAAGLALFAPPKMLDERKGYSSIKVHKILAVIHLTSMIATNILAGQMETNPDLRPYHRAAAFTAFGALAAAMIIIKF